ncbi:hypothetical protein [Kitasatospora camelliae]|uniref:Uncharacterized protein n=1 Tax=Kitasatospora camelliae TaxID=3156397 RepID=A0AAU8JTX6_9ACTN
MRTNFRSVGQALRLAEGVLMRQARRNAWAAVCENRRLAADRDRGGPLPGRTAEPGRRA